MIDPFFLLQSGPYLSQEKYACALSSYAHSFCPYGGLADLDIERHRLHSIPVGSVEFTRRYCERVGISLPLRSLSYYPGTEQFTLRRIKLSTFSAAEDGDFVKPVDVKLFTGGLKNTLNVPPSTPVWVSEPVPFESEFRFYVQTTVSESMIIGWSRYDNLDVVNPDPDHGLVVRISDAIRADLGPSSFSVDIGWRPDLGVYDLVEVNDAWSLGLYRNSDPQSSPPTNQDYAEMLVSRWRQILFCNL